MASAQQRPHCRNCVHYYVTWDNRRPYGCKALGFKSDRPPCQVVYETSGMPCRIYRARATRRPAPARG